MQICQCLELAAVCSDWTGYTPGCLFNILSMAPGDNLFKGVFRQHEIPLGSLTMAFEWLPL